MSDPYHKIQTVFLRDPATNYKTLLAGEYARPEFKYLANKEWTWTEKVDGTNIRIIYNNDGLSWRGRTDKAEIHKPLDTAISNLVLLECFEEAFGREPTVCLYGEGYGAKVQKGGGNYRLDQSFVLFDVSVNGCWLQRENVEDVGRALGIDTVPVIGSGTLPEMIERADLGIQSVWGDFMAEGIVARPAVELLAHNGERVITKIKCKDFAKAVPA